MIQTTVSGHRNGDVIPMILLTETALNAIMAIILQMETVIYANWKVVIDV